MRRLKRRLPPCRRLAAGTSLLEVLVALVVVSLGVLGMLGLQLQAQRQARLSGYRTVASQLATDLTERMRANRDSARGLVHYALTLPASRQVDPSSGTLLLAVPPVRCDAPTATCSQAELAAEDLFQWRSAVHALLPQGVVRVQPLTVSATGTTALQCGMGAAPCESADLWIGWRGPTPLAGDGSTGGEGLRCPAGLGVSEDASWQCHFVRVRL